MAISDTQKFLLFFLPKFGFLSVLSSALIACTILRDPKKMGKSYHRVLLAMSCVDVFTSTGHATSTWPMPEDSGSLYAMGNQVTCSIQGFFTQNSVVPSFFSVSLAIYYTLVIRYDWSEAHVRKVEPYLTSVPILWGLSTGIIAIPLKLYNPAGLWCWIAAYPAGCVGEECIRGINFNTYRWAFFYGPLWLNIVFVTTAMFLVWQHVRTNVMPQKQLITPLMHQESAAAENKELTDKELFFLQYDDPAQAEREWLTRKIKRDIAFQGFLYSGSFYLTWVWLTCVRFLQLMERPVPYPLLAAASFFSPLQGVFNMMIYLYPKFKAVKEAKPDAGVFQWIRESMAV